MLRLLMIPIEYLGIMMAGSGLKSAQRKGYSAIYILPCIITGAPLINANQDIHSTNLEQV